MGCVVPSLLKITKQWLNKQKGFFFFKCILRFFHQYICWSWAGQQETCCNRFNRVGHKIHSAGGDEGARNECFLKDEENRRGGMEEMRRKRWRAIFFFYRLAWGKTKTLQDEVILTDALHFTVPACEHGATPQGQPVCNGPADRLPPRFSWLSHHQSAISSETRLTSFYDNLFRLQRHLRVRLKSDIKSLKLMEANDYFPLLYLNIAAP